MELEIPYKALGYLLLLQIMNFKRLNDMIQDINDINDLSSFGLNDEEISGYLEFFATNIIEPLSTIFGDIDVEN